MSYKEDQETDICDNVNQEIEDEKKLKAYDNIKKIVEWSFIDKKQFLDLPLYLQSLNEFPDDYLSQESLLKSFVELYNDENQKISLAAMKVLIYIMEHASDETNLKIVDLSNIKEKTLTFLDLINSDQLKMDIMRLVTCICTIDSDYFNYFGSFFEKELSTQNEQLFSVLVNQLYKLIQRTENEMVVNILQITKFPTGNLDNDKVLFDCHLLLAKQKIFLLDIDRLVSDDFAPYRKQVLLLLLELASDDDDFCEYLTEKSNVLEFLLNSNFLLLSLALLLLIAGSPCGFELLPYMDRFIDIYRNSEFKIKISALKVVLQILMTTRCRKMTEDLYCILEESLTYENHDILMLSLISLINLRYFTDESIKNASELLQSGDKEVFQHASYYLKLYDDSQNSQN